MNDENMTRRKEHTEGLTLRSYNLIFLYTLSIHKESDSRLLLVAAIHTGGNVFPGVGGNH